ncbi:MAG: Cof-type family hydrolase [Firmicutes bacterium]|nr:Cof-type family hydrolase [Bacillota bacterium]
MQYRVLLFDLDGTLLRSDKTISGNTINIINMCRKKGVIIGVSTSRSKKNIMIYLDDLNPEIAITSGGALVHLHDKIIYTANFMIDEVNHLIETARAICGKLCEITVDTLNEHYWNYKIDPQKLDANWGSSIYTDFEDFNLEALKVCVEIHNPVLAQKLKNVFPEYDCIRFSDGDWYKFTKKNATKENAITYLCDYCNISKESIIAFGDDYSDIGMLKLCGIGIAMGNAIQDVKVIADEVIGRNDDDGIADYLMRKFMI